MGFNHDAHHAFQQCRIAAHTHGIVVGCQLGRLEIHHLHGALRRNEINQAALFQRIDGHDFGAAQRDFPQIREHTRVVGARVVADGNQQIAFGQIFQRDGGLAHADSGRQADAGGLVAHIGAVGIIIVAVFAAEQLIQKRRFVGSAPRSVEFHALGIIALQQRAHFGKCGVPVDGLIGITLGIVFHRMRQAAAVFQIVIAPSEQFAHGMLRKKFGRGALGRGFP